MPNPIEIGDPSNILSSGLKVHGNLIANAIQPKDGNTVTINGECLYVGYDAAPSDTTYSIYASHGIKIEGQSVGNSTTPIYIDSTGGFMPCTLAQIETFTRTKAGLVPAPGGSTTTKYLREDGAWIAPPNTTYTQGDGIAISGTTISNSGVRSISTGSSNGTISVNTGGTSTNISVKGLGSAAYTSSGNYLPSNANAYFDSGAQTGERSLHFKNTSGTNIHDSYIYGGNPSSTTAIGIYDGKNNHGVILYSDSNNRLHLGNYDDYDTDIRLNGPVKIGGHSSAIGTVVSATSTTKSVSAVSVESLSGTNLTSITLPAGVWVITAGFYTAQWSANSTGMVRICLGTTATDISLNPANNNGAGSASYSNYASVAPLYGEVVCILNATSETTRYLNAAHTLDFALNFTGQIRAVRIA